MNTSLGVSAAVAAAASFATAAVLQQRVAARADRAALSVGLVASLARQRTWLIGVALAAASYGLQALALSQQPLTVVQPLLVSEVLIAIPLSARLFGRALHVQEWTGLLLLAAGLAATVWASAPHGDGGDPAGPTRWAVTVGTLGGATAVLALLARGRPALTRARLYAGAAALLFAMAAALLAATVEGLADSGLAVFAGPAPYGVAVAELAATVFMQSAFQAGPLAVAMPIVNWLQPLVAVLLGIGVLGESIAADPGHLAALAAGAVGALTGILVLNGSPAMQAMHSSPAAGPRPAAAQAGPRPTAAQAGPRPAAAQAEHAGQAGQAGQAGRAGKAPGPRSGRPSRRPGLLRRPATGAPVAAGGHRDRTGPTVSAPHRTSGPRGRAHDNPGRSTEHRPRRDRRPERRGGQRL